MGMYLHRGYAIIYKRKRKISNTSQYIDNYDYRRDDIIGEIVS